MLSGTALHPDQLFRRARSNTTSLTRIFELRVDPLLGIERHAPTKAIGAGDCGGIGIRRRRLLRLIGIR